LLLYVITDSKYPNNDALTTRITLVSKIFFEANVDVCVLSRTQLESGVFDGISYVSMRNKTSSTIGKVFEYMLSFKKNVIEKIKSTPPDAILIYNCPTGVLKKIYSMQKKLGYAIYIDCVEWFSKEQVGNSLIGKIQYYKRNYWMEKLLPGRISVLAISQYLKTYFETQKTPCIYVPSVCDCNAVMVSNKRTVNAKKVKISYAGSPGKKDFFDSVVRAIRKLNDKDRECLELNIIGASKQAIAENAQCTVQELDELGDCIHILPRMKHEVVLEHLKNSDFTILIRPEHLRYAKAGFPTKVPESLSVGTPVICNLTSDLAMFLEDGVNAIIAKGSDVDSVYEALKRAISLTEEQRTQMYKNARETAENKFDYRLYAKAVNEFVAIKRG